MDPLALVQDALKGAVNENGCSEQRMQQLADNPPAFTDWRSSRSGSETDENDGVEQ